MQESTEANPTTDADIHERHRRTYQALLVIAICLAVVGSPMLMQGVVALVIGISEPPSQQAASSLGSGFVHFLIGASPMGLAGFTWSRIKSLQRVLEQEEQERKA